jgi:hypothetical protein
MKNTTIKPLFQDDMKSITTRPIEILEPETSLLVEAQTEVEMTYEAHVDAQKNFVEAFKGIAQIDKTVYQEAEKKFLSYKKAIARALKTRETAERAAQRAYKKTVIIANAAYQEAIQKALDECQQATEKAGMTLKTSSPGIKNRRGSQFLNILQQLYLSAISVLKTITLRVNQWFKQNYQSVNLRATVWLRQLNRFLLLRIGVRPDK